MRSRFHEAAAAELDEAMAHYERKAIGLGVALLDEVRAAVASIETYPESSSVVERGVRWKVLAKFPYDLFYTVSDEEIFILSVAHESRRPGIWRRRAR